SKNDAGGFEIPEARDSFSDLDDAILDDFSLPRSGKSRNRRRKTETARPDAGLRSDGGASSEPSSSRTANRGDPKHHGSHGFHGENQSWDP
ncbi:MAG: hypothetical protein ABIA59_10295, partial [Candidatus Latescibacterota bacterium]